MSLYEHDKLPTTSGEALIEYSDRYLAAQLAAIPPAWVDEFGDAAPLNSPMATFPLSAMSGKFRETEGDSVVETMGEEKLDLKVIEYDMGYEAKLIDLLLQVFAYRSWTQSAEYSQIAEQNHRADSIATLLEAGETTTIWNGGYFFRTNHPNNTKKPGLGTSSNYQASPKDCNSIANIIAERTAMRLVKDANGKKLNVNPDVILVPTEKFELVDALIRQTQVSVASGTGVPGGGTASMSNPLAGLRAVHVPTFTDPDDWYLVDSQLVKRMPPWLCARWSPGLALELRQWDENSDFFRNTGKLKNSAHIWYAFALAFWQAIRKIKGA